MAVNDSGTPAAPAARVLGGRYRLAARRGTGYDAAVFEAVDEALQRPVTVKVVHPDLSADPEVRQRLRVALDRAVTLSHPNLAEVLDWGVDRWNDQEVVYVVIEHLAGGSLREIIDRGRRLSPSQTLQVGVEVCKGLAALHEHQHAHGDVRPSTVVFGHDGRARLVDVGLGEVLAASTWSDPARVTNERAAYAAPEVGTSGTLGPKGDVYSLCLTMLEATTGNVPFLGDSRVTTLANRVGKLMPVSADLGSLASPLERAGRPDPADRYTAAEFGRALAQASANQPRPAPIPLIGGGLFEHSPDAATQAVPVVASVGALDDPTFPTLRADDDDLVVVEQTSPLADPVAPLSPTPTPAPTPTQVLPIATQDVATPSLLRRIRPLRLVAVALVGLLVGAALGWVLTPVRSHVVPDLVGVERGEALNTISEFGWQITVTREASDTVPIDAVVRTDPVAGSSVREGDPFTMVVSNGPAPRVLPELAGVTVEVATSQLTEIGLVLQQAPAEFSETIPVGTIIRWRVPSAPGLVAGDTVVIGTTIEVVASAGPAPRVVPDLTGLDAAAADAVLAQNGLVASVAPEQQFSDLPAGQVMGQDPAAGTEVTKGATVTYVISKGPDVVALPPLVGTSLADATSALVAAGFQVGAAQGNVQGTVVEVSVGGAVVADQALVPRGATVDLALF